MLSGDPWAQTAGSLMLGGAGTKLRALPGFSDAVESQRITGVGALQCFLELLSEFAIEEKAPKASARSA